MTNYREPAEIQNSDDEYIEIDEPKPKVLKGGIYLVSNALGTLNKVQITEMSSDKKFVEYNDGLRQWINIEQLKVVSTLSEPEFIPKKIKIIKKKTNKSQSNLEPEPVKSKKSNFKNKTFLLCIAYIAGCLHALCAFFAFIFLSGHWFAFAIASLFFISMYIIQLFSKKIENE